MIFSVVLKQASIPNIAIPGVFGYLVTDDWNDWFKYCTQYYLVIRVNNENHAIGSVKIGQFNWQAGQVRPTIPQQFSLLDNSFFSLGQSDSYYESMNQLDEAIRIEVFSALKDMAYDLSIFESAAQEKITNDSLLRSIRRETLINQYSRISRGGVRLTDYQFKFQLNQQEGNPLEFEFKVVPGSNPPSNIHILIGRNGVGKTRLLSSITNFLLRNSTENGEILTFNDGSGKYQKYNHEDPLGFLGKYTNKFTNLVRVSFSAFDQSDVSSAAIGSKPSEISSAYIGLMEEIIDRESNTPSISPKTPNKLSTEFSKCICGLGEEKRGRWHKLLSTLEADPLFSEIKISETLHDGNDESHMYDLFKKLSSGHKIVLLTLTKLVETVEEKTLVLIDEPEAHLHPPFAFRLLTRIIRFANKQKRLSNSSHSFSGYTTRSSPQLRMENKKVRQGHRH